MNFPEESTNCTICHENQAKYTCPACGIKTCSLVCYKEHQEERECSGKVDSNRYLNRDELAADPVHLNRDYNFLTLVDRLIQVGKEDITKSAKNVFKRKDHNIIIPTINDKDATKKKTIKINELQQYKKCF